MQDLIEQSIRFLEDHRAEWSVDNPRGWVSVWDSGAGVLLGSDFEELLARLKSMGVLQRAIVDGLRVNCEAIDRFLRRNGSL